MNTQNELNYQDQRPNFSQYSNILPHITMQPQQQQMQQAYSQAGSNNADNQIIAILVIIVFGIVIGTMILLTYVLPMFALYVGYLGKMVKKGMNDSL